MKGLVFDNQTECNNLIELVWVAIKPPYAPNGTLKPQSVKHPTKNNWAFIFKKYGYYYEKIKTVLTEQQIESIVEIGEDWLGNQ